MSVSSDVTHVDAPVFASKPHFLDADPGFLSNVTGLSPNREKHDSFLDAEPVSGVGWAWCS